MPPTAQVPLSKLAEPTSSGPKLKAPTRDAPATARTRHGRRKSHLGLKGIVIKSHGSADANFASADDANVYRDVA